MEEVLLNILKDVPFTLAMGFIFFLLSRQVLNNSRQDNASKDALIGRLIDLLGKLSGVVESLELKLDAFGTSLESRTEAIQEQTTAVGELREEIEKLRKFIDAEIGFQRPSNKLGSHESNTRLKTTKLTNGSGSE